VKWKLCGRNLAGVLITWEWILYQIFKIIMNEQSEKQVIQDNKKCKKAIKPRSNRQIIQHYVHNKNII
jgi:hypothetical protein